DQAKTVNHIIGNKALVVAVHFAVVTIIVAFTVADIGGERTWQVFGFVAGDEINHVIGDQRREPANAITRCREIARKPHRRRGHDFDLCRIATSFASSLADKADAPGNKVGIGELQYHAIGDATGEVQDLRAVARDPHWRRALGPGNARRLTLVVDLASGG